MEFERHKIFYGLRVVLGICRSSVFVRFLETWRFFRNGWNFGTLVKML